MKKWYKRIDKKRIERRELMYNSENHTLDDLEFCGDFIGHWFYP